MPKLAKLINLSRMHFTASNVLLSRAADLHLAAVLRGAVMLADSRPEKTITHPLYRGQGISRKVSQKVNKSKTSGRRQASCHLFCCFSVSLKVKGHGAKCVWECSSLTRCMCFCLLMYICATCCEASQWMFLRQITKDS